MSVDRFLQSICMALVLAPAGYFLAAQAKSDQVATKLVGQPLYLRGLWMGPNLEFDGAGKLLGTAHQWPFTLSGIDVTGVSVQGKELVIRANRVALVANSEGVLERRNLSSTTRIFPSLRRGDGNKFIANLEVKLVVHADEDGSFDQALKAIFANGFRELAATVPPYWSCYAEGYFAEGTTAIKAEQTVEDCVKRRSLSGTEAESYRGQAAFADAQIVSAVAPTFTQLAASVGVDGVSHVRFTVTQQGIPVGFQVVRAVGAGMDEETLKAASESKFQPATMNGVPVTSDLDVSQAYHTLH
jgi:TonB family protein